MRVHDGQEEYGGLRHVGFDDECHVKEYVGRMNCHMREYKNL